MHLVVTLEHSTPRRAAFARRLVERRRGYWTDQ